MALSDLSLISATLILSVSCLIFSSGSIRDAEEDLKTLAIANNELAVNLYKQLSSGSKKNIIISPFSISSLLGMLLCGAGGETAQELRTVLGYETANLTNEIVHTTFKRFLRESIKLKMCDSFILNVANGILVDKSIKLMPDYKKKVQELYQASVRSVDFIKSGPTVVKEINDWIKENTKGKIGSITDNLNSSTLLVLLNAVYFRGTWQYQFDEKQTKQMKFYNKGLESEAKEVSTMSTAGSFSYAALSDMEVLELPYKGNISMIVLLPKKRDGLKTLENTLTREKLASIREQLNVSNVQVCLPKFKLEGSEALSEHIKGMGANKTFQPMCDLSGMTSSKEIYVNQVLHKAVVEVNEKGSEASALTGVKALSASSVPSFTADHPFLFFIAEENSDMILFMGCVNIL